MLNITLNRTFWPVGHGAFYTEEHIFFFFVKAFCAVYDCGGKSQKIICNRVDEFLDSVRDVKTKNRPTIDYLFISHFHRDHINGVCYLLEKANVEHIVIPQLENARLIEAYIYNAITGDNINYTQDVSSFALYVSTVVRSSGSPILLLSSHRDPLLALRN